MKGRLRWGLVILGLLGAAAWLRPRADTQRPPRSMASTSSTSSTSSSPDPTQTPVRSTLQRDEPQALLRTPPVEQADAGGISGSVRNAANLAERTVWVQATCGGRALVDQDGDFFLYGRPGECVLKAMRRHGALIIWGEPVTLQVEKNGEHEVQLTIPDWKPAGLGISLAEDEFGIRVARVFPNSPAEGFGLKNGDIILEIDGIPTTELSANEFVEFGVGPEGTDVELLVATQDGEHAVTLTREFVSRQDPHTPHEVTGRVAIEELEDGSLEVIRIPEGMTEEEAAAYLQENPIRRRIPAPSED